MRKCRKILISQTLFTAVEFLFSLLQYLNMCFHVDVAVCHVVDSVH